MKNMMDNEVFQNSSIFFLNAMEQNLLSLTSIADQKGSVLLGFNFLIISFVITQVVLHGVRFDLLVILLFSLIIVLLAIRALWPRVAPQKKENRNLLFFDVISKMEEQAFACQIFELLHAESSIYQVKIKNIHQISQVLQKKYYYLRWAYRVCFFGCFIGVLLVLLAFSTYFLKFLGFF